VGVVVVDPFAGMRCADDWSDWVRGQQRLDRVMSRVAPPLFQSAVASAAGAALVAAAHRQGAVAAGRAVAAGCTGAAVATTLVVNEPANAQIRAWRPTDAPPADWRTVRARWERAHRVRRVLLAAAALASLGGEASSRWATHGAG
jgi:Domain of unknown function (DUF1772)